jgi:hypothetical protein
VSTMSQLAALADAQLAAQATVERLEEELKAAKAALRAVAEEQLPDAMEALSLQQFTTDAGVRIKVETVIRAGISKDRAADAFAWLRDNGHGSIIKNTVAVVFEDDADARVLAAKLRNTYLTVEEKPTVNHMTLGAFVRDMLAAGHDVPLDLLGVYHQRVSKVEVK